MILDLESIINKSLFLPIWTFQMLLILLISKSFYPILKSINISSEAIQWFYSHLHGREQYIRLNDKQSSVCSLNAVVPQGGVLSLYFFPSSSNPLLTFYRAWLMAGTPSGFFLYILLIKKILLFNLYVMEKLYMT